METESKKETTPETDRRSLWMGLGLLTLAFGIFGNTKKAKAQSPEIRQAKGIVARSENQIGTMKK